MEFLISYWPTLFLVYSTSFFIIISPGPSSFTIINNSMSLGRKAGLYIMMGVVLGAITWGVLGVIGVSAILALNPNAIIFLKLFGCGYLMYLSLSALKKAIKNNNFQIIKNSTFGRPSILKGYAVHMTNPEAMMGWAALITLGLTENAPPNAPLLILMGCFTIAITVYSSYAILFSYKKVMSVYDLYGRFFEGLFFLIFAFASMTLFFSVIG